MTKKIKPTIFRRLLALALVLTVGMTFIPLMSAEATENPSPGDPGLKAFEVLDDGTEVEIDPAVVPEGTDEVPVGDPAGEVQMKGLGPNADAGEGSTVIEAKEADLSGVVIVDEDTFPDGPVKTVLNPEIKGLVGPGAQSGDPDAMTAQEDGDDVLISQEDAAPTIKQDKKTGRVTITGTLYEDTFYAVAVDDTVVVEPSRLGTSVINTSFDMKSVSNVGYHTIYVFTTSVFRSTGLPTYYKDYVPTYVYSKPVNKPRRYEVYSKYMYYKTKGNYYSYDEDCLLYLEYKKGGSKAKRYGGMESYSTYKVSGLKGHKKYKVKAYYGKRFTYQGTEYFFSGKNSGAVSRTQKIITGQPKKPPVKALRRAVSHVKRHKVRYYYYGHYLYTRRYYTYKSTAVIRMKKRPGAKGIIYNGYRLKGNKRTYKKFRGFFSSTSRPHSCRLTKVTSVYIYSYQSKKYGGYSPILRRR